jgi:hypothetical protein
MFSHIVLPDPLDTLVPTSSHNRLHGEATAKHNETFSLLRETSRDTSSFPIPKYIPAEARLQHNAALPRLYFNQKRLPSESYIETTELRITPRNGLRGTEHI